MECVVALSLETCCASFELLQGRALQGEKGQAKGEPPLRRCYEAGGGLVVVVPSDMLVIISREAVAAILASISWKTRGIWEMVVHRWICSDLESHATVTPA